MMKNLQVIRSETFLTLKQDKGSASDGTTEKLRAIVSEIDATLTGNVH